MKKPKFKLVRIGSPPRRLDWTDAKPLLVLVGTAAVTAMLTTLGDNAAALGAFWGPIVATLCVSALAALNQWRKDNQ